MVSLVKEKVLTCPYCDFKRVVLTHSGKEYRCLNCGNYFTVKKEKGNVRDSNSSRT